MREVEGQEASLEAGHETRRAPGDATGQMADDSAATTASSADAAEMSAAEAEEAGELTFDLDADEEGLLEEFGVLMAAEYNYGITRDSGSWVLPPEVSVAINPDLGIMPPVNLEVNLKRGVAQGVDKRILQDHRPAPIDR